MKTIFSLNGDDFLIFDMKQIPRKEDMVTLDNQRYFVKGVAWSPELNHVRIHLKKAA
jgi:hypothetical protein